LPVKELDLSLRRVRAAQEVDVPGREVEAAHLASPRPSGGRQEQSRGHSRGPRWPRKEAVRAERTSRSEAMSLPTRRRRQQQRRRDSPCPDTSSATPASQPWSKIQHFSTTPCSPLMSAHLRGQSKRQTRIASRPRRTTPATPSGRHSGRLAP
jgi:hypothetical protein